MNPKVSIIIPVYNGSNFLSEAINSALSQTYQNIEIIVINDGSCDNGATEKIALSYSDKIKYISKENGGVSSALNTGIKAASGEWISWLSHDDIYSPDKIEEQIKDFISFSKNNPDARNTLFYCLGGFIDSNGQIIKKITKKTHAGYVTSNDALYNIFDGNIPGGCGFLIPRKLFDDAGYFDEELRYSQDVFMWIKAYLAGYGMFINKKIMSFTRIHKQQCSSTLKPLAAKDRLTVGNYLVSMLPGLVTSKGKNIEKKYLLECAKKQISPIGDIIYKSLLKQKKLTLYDKIKYRIMSFYGMLRPVLVTVYYRIKTKTSR